MPGTRYNITMAIYLEDIPTIVVFVIIVILCVCAYIWRSHHGLY